MHREAKEYVARFATDDEIVVYELGSLNINGTVRDLFPNAAYTGVDIREGKDVDVVEDGKYWQPRKKADLVVCCEVLEHCDGWPELIVNAYRMLKKNGKLIVTAAGPTRTPHSGFDGGPLHDGEFYANIRSADLVNVLQFAQFGNIQVDVLGDDVRVEAEKI